MRHAAAFLRGFGLALMAVAQPLWSMLLAQPGFFAARAADASDLLLVWGLPLAVAVHWGAAAALTGAEAASAAAAAAVLALQGASGAPWPLALAAGLLAGGAAAWAARREAGSAFLTWTAAAALSFPLLFLARAPWPGRAAPAGPSAPGAPVRTVVVVFDELPLASLLAADGGIDPVWYPNFARLAREGAWYREARTVSDDTLKAVPALLSGVYPRPPKVPWAKDYPVNLFTRLAGTHELRVFESHTALCPAELCRPVRPPFGARAVALASDLAVLFAQRTAPRALSGRLPSVSHSWKGFARPEEPFSWDALNAAAGESYVDRAGAFRRFIEAAAAPGAAPLAFLHVMLPHPPWVYLPSGARVFAPNEPIVLGDNGREDRWENDPAVAAAAWQRHILQVRFTDRLVGELLAALEAAGVWDKTLLVLAADHGASFKAGGRRRLRTAENAGEVEPIPLFIHYPGGSPRGPQDARASVLDVLPTVLAAQGEPSRDRLEGFDGRDLRGGPGARALWVLRDGSELPEPAGWAAARREADRRRSLLGDGSRPDALYRLGPAASFVGRRGDELPRSSRPPCSFRLEQAAAGKVPYSRAYLSGRVVCPSGVAGQKGVLAVADGSVVASGRTGPFYGTEDAALRLMLPETSEREGRLPDLFIGFEGRGGLEFAPLMPEGARWRRAGRTLSRSDGRVAEVKGPGGRRETPEAQKDVLVLRGDARAGGAPAEEVLVFSGGDCVYAGRPERSSGRFDFALPRDLLAEGTLEVFAVRGAEAWELPVQ